MADAGQTDNSAPMAFVAGHPISHSRSPLIHGHWLASLGLSGQYRAVDVAPGTLADHLAQVRDGLWRGGNITVPLKEEALSLVDVLTPLATRIGAVNTVWMQDGHLHGDNTDIFGFAANLDQRAPQWRHARSALVIGAGGAARAVLLALIEAGFEQIHLLNRTVERAQALADQFGPTIKPGPLGDFQSHLRNDLGPAGLVVNTTSLGMAGKETGSPDDVATAALLDFSAAPTGTIVTDIVYVPLETPFLAAARMAGLTAVDGLGMLLHQAVPGFERWFGVRPEVTPHLRALIEADLLRPKQ